MSISKEVRRIRDVLEDLVSKDEIYGILRDRPVPPAQEPELVEKRIRRADGIDVEADDS
jgi:hypothetical protein